MKKRQWHDCRKKLPAHDREVILQHKQDGKITTEPAKYNIWGWENDSKGVQLNKAIRWTEKEDDEVSDM